MSEISIPLEIKSLTEEGRFAGYASLFGNVDSQQDVIEHGAFAQTLADNEGDVKLLWQHQMNEPIGQIDELFEDEKGLYIEGRLLLCVQQAREAYELVKIGALKGLSIGYRPIVYTINPETGVRHIRQVDLFEVSLVTFPANEAAGITVVKNANIAQNIDVKLPASQMVELSETINRATAALR